MSSATMGWLAGQGCGVHLTCTRRVYVAGDMPGESFELHMLKGHSGLHMSAAEAVERWGAETSLDQVVRRARCRLCGARWPDLAIETSTPSEQMGIG